MFKEDYSFYSEYYLSGNNLFSFNDLTYDFDNINNDNSGLNNESNLYFLPPSIPLNENLNDNNNRTETPSDNNKENNFIDISNRVTNDITDNRIACLIKKDLIFNIKKEKRAKLGRKRKNQVYINKENTHSRSKADNIITKVKRNVNDNNLDLVNTALSISDNKYLKGIRLKKIDMSLITVSKKEENLELLKKPLKEILSSKLSTKYKTNFDPDYNKKQIDKILKHNDEELNSILNKNFLDMIHLYVNPNKEDNIFKYFKRIDKDLEKFKKDNVDDSYIKSYAKIANSFEDKIKAIYSRRKRKIN